MKSSQHRKKLSLNKIPSEMRRRTTGQPIIKFDSKVVCILLLRKTPKIFISIQMTAYCAYLAYIWSRVPQVYNRETPLTCASGATRWRHRFFFIRFKLYVMWSYAAHQWRRVVGKNLTKNSKLNDKIKGEYYLKKK